MTDPIQGGLVPGDRAPDFDLPAADGEGRVALAEHLRNGPVLLTMLRGLYCSFCRRHISQLRPTCVEARSAGLSLLGIVVASPERARQYFGHFPPCFPMAAAPDRATHRAYGLPQVDRTPAFRQETERRAAEILRELAVEAPVGQATAVFATADGFEMTPEDQAEWQRPLQSVAYFLIGRDGLIRWTRVEPRIVPLPKLEELLSMI
jgi:peroxiredoxin